MALKRRSVLGALSAACTVGLAGCIRSDGDGGELRGEYVADPATAEFSYECEQVDLFDDDVHLSGRLSARLVGSAVAEWHVDIDADKDLQIGVSNVEFGSKARPPTVEIIGPDEMVLLEDSDGSSVNAVSTTTDGTHIIRLRSREWTARERWSIEVSWYNETGCTRFTKAE